MTVAEFAQELADGIDSTKPTSDQVNDQIVAVEIRLLKAQVAQLASAIAAIARALASR